MILWSHVASKLPILRKPWFLPLDAYATCIYMYRPMHSAVYAMTRCLSFRLSQAGVLSKCVNVLSRFSVQMLRQCYIRDSKNKKNFRLDSGILSKAGSVSKCENLEGGQKLANRSQPFLDQSSPNLGGMCDSVKYPCNVFNVKRNLNWCILSNNNN